MKQPLFLKNIPIDEKRIAFLEKVVSRLARRTKKTTPTIIPSYPIMAYGSGEDVKGCVFKGVLFKGKLSKAVLLFNKKPKGKVNVEIKTLSDDEGEARTFYVDKLKSEVDLGIDTIDGTVLSVSVSPVGDFNITEFWASVLWIPHVSDAEVKQHLIEDVMED